MSALSVAPAGPRPLSRLASAPRHPGRGAVSVLILTFNEEDNILRCLESVAWAGDILVLDSFSTDRTVEIAEAWGARVLRRQFDTFAGQRNYGIDHGALAHDWVLHLDADEVVPAALRDELLAIAGSGGDDAYRLGSKMMFQGKWLRRSGMYPAYQVRFGRRDRLRFEQVGHGQRETLPGSDLGTLEHPVEHYSFSKGYHDWFERHNRYSTAEAAKVTGRGGPPALADLFMADRTARRRAMKDLAPHLPFRPLLRFLYGYVVKRGFLDGRAGFTYCTLMAVYEYMIVVKERDLLARAAPHDGAAPPVGRIGPGA